MAEPAVMSGTLSVPRVAQRALVVFLLLAASVACWGLLMVQTGHRGFDSGLSTASPTMGLPADAFLALWVMVTIAMMLPTAAPMVLTFHRVENGKEEWSEALVATWLFVAGYIAVWAVAGVLTYLGMLAAEAISARESMSVTAAARVGGGLLVAAGLYQLTPLKTLCLGKCRSPLAFVLTEWRDGTTGALRMGLLHGAICLGSSWLLMAILFPLGFINIMAMVLVTALIFAEKVVPWQRSAVYGIAGLLIAYGGLVLATPQALPTFVAPTASITPIFSSTPKAVPMPPAAPPAAVPSAAVPPPAASPAPPPASPATPPTTAPARKEPPPAAALPAALPASPSTVSPPPPGTANSPAAMPATAPSLTTTTTTPVEPAAAAAPQAAGPTLKPGGAMSLEKW